MVKVIASAHGSGRYEITCTGHATGHEDVCSAVSALTQALGLYLVKRQDKLLIEDLTLASGQAHIAYDGAFAPDAAAAIYTMTVEALEALAEQFPDAVRVIRGGDDPNG